MPTKVTKVGFEGILKQGAAGSSAATAITTVRDKTIQIAKTTAVTDYAGDGTGPIVESVRVVSLKVTVTFTMVNKSDDASLAALLTAAAAGSPIALRGLDYTSGKGPDMDFVLDVSNGQPYKGEQTFDFTAEATDEAGRTPALSLVWC